MQTNKKNIIQNNIINVLSSVKLKNYIFLVIIIYYLKIFSIENSDYKQEEIKISGYKTFTYFSSTNPRAWKVEFSKNELDNIKKFIHKGDFIIDIGAWEGDTSVKYALVTGRSGKVLAFEPLKNMYDILRLNADTHTNIIPINKAITKKKGSYLFHFDDLFTNGGFGQSVDMGPTYIGNATQEVDGVNLKEYLYENNLIFKRISFIKTDCEGYDHKILKSMSSLVQKNRPIIQMEVLTGFLSDNEIIDYWKTLLTLDDYLIFKGALGYDVEEIFSHKITNLDEFMNLPKNAADILCLPLEEFEKFKNKIQKDWKMYE